MLSDDEIERLIVSMEANTSKFDKAIAGTNDRLDAILSSMEKRADTFQARFDKAMEGAGRSMRRVMEGIGISLSFEGLKRFVESVTETAMNVKKQSAAIGVSASTFQAWSIMAKKADVDQQVLNTTLERFASNIGMAQLKVTAFGKEMQKYLGPDALKGSVEDVIYRFADFMQRVQSPTQRAAMLRLAAGGTGGGGLGGGGVALAQFFGQGSASMKAQAEQLKASGEIIPEDELEKIQKLDRAWIDLKATLSVGGAEALTGFVDGFQHLSGTITDQRFQDGLRSVGQLLGEIIKTLGSNPKILAALAGIGIGGFVGGLPGAAIGGLGAVAVAGSAMGPSEASVRTQIADINKQMDASSPVNRQRLAHLHAQLKAMTEIPDAPTVTPINPGVKALQTDIDLSGSLETTAFDKAVQSLKLRTAALRDQTGEFANYSQAQEAARVSTELMSAAQEDAAKHETKVSRQTLDEIERLSQAYGRLAAAKEFDKDLGGEDDRIAKLKAEALAAGATARQLAELETREELLADFHKRYGDKATPSADQMSAINARAAGAGSAQAGADWTKIVDQAQRQIGQGQARNSEIGLFGPQLAETQMRMQLLNAAMQAGQPITADVLATITRLSTEYGALAQAAYTTTESFERQRSVTDDLRNGLDNIATAGMHGFNSLKSAASGFLDQLAALVLKLYVVQPLLEQAFGPPGTAGGGALGGFLANLLNTDPLAPVTVTPAVTAGSGTGIGAFFESLFNFADGGVMTPSGPRKLKRFAGGGMSSTAAIFGEAGPEAAVPLPDGRSIPVSLRMPMTPTVPQLPSPNVSVTYAPVNQITGNDPSTVAQVRSLIHAHEQNMPAMIHTTVTQMARRKAGPWN